MNEPLRLVSVLTRGYDEPGEGTATLARYAAAGHEVMVVACTGGDGETAGLEVLEVLGVGRHWLGYRDSRSSGTFASTPVEEPTERLVRVLREFRPHVVVVYGDVEDRDPDRVRCREVSVAAFDAAGDPRRFPSAGEAWQPRKLYHVHEWHGERMRALHEALLAEGLVSPYHEWLAEPADAGRITTRVPCGDYFPLRDQVLRMHADQLDPTSHWFAVPARVRQAVWPTEDFELARCHVPTSLPEDDLFAGIN
jgi:mycothiol S-conjugate amidase